VRRFAREMRNDIMAARRKMKSVDQGASVGGKDIA
jgi:hypothetical protein